MAGDYADSERLLRALADHLKTPLLQIARQAELKVSTNLTLESISSIAEMSLRFIDGFLLNAEHRKQTSLNLEPVSVSAVLYDTAQALEPLARQYECELEVQLSGKYGPVIADEKSLRAAFTLLGYSLLAGRAHQAPHRLILAAHRSNQGLVAGLFDNQPGLSTDMFKRGKALYGHARQAMPAVGAGAAAGIFIADSLLKNMESPLHLARHSMMNGLAATLVQSKQLQLV